MWRSVGCEGGRGVCVKGGGVCGWRGRGGEVHGWGEAGQGAYAPVLDRLYATQAQPNSHIVRSWAAPQSDGIPQHMIV